MRNVTSAAEGMTFCRLVELENGDIGSAHSYAYAYIKVHKK